MINLVIGNFHWVCYCTPALVYTRLHDHDQHALTDSVTNLAYGRQPGWPVCIGSQLVIFTHPNLQFRPCKRCSSGSHRHSSKWRSCFCSRSWHLIHINCLDAGSWIHAAGMVFETVNVYNATVIYWGDIKFLSPWFKFSTITHMSQQFKTCVHHKPSH